jgi:hypothetical protein
MIGDDVNFEIEGDFIQKVAPATPAHPRNNHARSTRQSFHICKGREHLWFAPLLCKP